MSIEFVETFRVGLWGNNVAIGKMASVTSQGDRITIMPVDPTNVPAVVAALTEAKLNAYALNPRTVVVGVPPVGGEQRRELARHVGKLGDEAKVAVWMIRHEARKQIAARGRGSERAVQEATDAAVEEIERLVKAKVAEMEIRGWTRGADSINKIANYLGLHVRFRVRLQGSKQANTGDSETLVRSLRLDTMCLAL